MSKTLPEDAHVEPESAVTSVEDPAPVSEDEVAEDSVGSDGKVIPVDRFNGLMSKFNQTQSELEATRTRLAELEARLTSNEQRQEEPPPVSDTENSTLQAQVETLTQMLVQERMEGARRQALEEYPEAAPFADLIVADTPDDVREMARLIAERARTANPASTSTEEGGEEETETSDTTEATGSETGAATEGSEEPPVAGGGAAFSSEASAEDRINDAVQKGSFADFINAKWEKQLVGGGDGLTLG